MASPPVDSPPPSSRGGVGCAVIGVVVALVLIGVMISSTISLIAAVRAARGEGSPGTFTATRESCAPRAGCSWYGVFVSEDGTVKLEDVLLDGSVDAVGDSLPVRYLGEGPKVHAYNSHEWVLALVFFILAALPFAYAGVRMRRKSPDT